MGAFGSLFSGGCSHLLVVSTHSTGRRFLCRAGSERFKLGITGWTVVRGFGAHGPIWCSEFHCTYNWGYAHVCLLALIETINKQDKKKTKITIVRTLHATI